MRGGKISGNILSGSGNNGGGVYISGGNFTMKDGIISGNSGIYGGGVYHHGAGAFTMTGGQITGCTASSGGGVYLNAGGTYSFNKTGGTIYGGSSIHTPGSSENRASTKGHTVYLQSGARYFNSTAGPEVTIYANNGGSGSSATFPFGWLP
ncbi:MAG: hypothetical protein LBP93_04880 [Treponema sp.]|jgi:hypothetical protein|nr:hypothetical protein [Treponema sp.]